MDGKTEIGSKSPALVMAERLQKQNSLSQSSGMDDTEVRAVNRAALKFGNQTVDNIGEEYAYRPPGGGRLPAPRMANMPIQSRGPVILGKTVGTGSSTASESEFRAARVAISEIDALEDYFQSLPGTSELVYSDNGFAKLDALTLSVPCAGSGVTTVLKVTGQIEVKADNSASYIESRLVIGSGESVGIPAFSNLDNAFGPVWNTPPDGSWHTVPLVHRRTIVGTDTTMNGVTVYPRIRRINGASGSTGGGSAKLEAGGTFKINASGVNMRSSPTTDAAVVAVLGTSNAGSILSGPTPANGFLWYGVNVTGVGIGYVASDYMTPTYNERPASNAYRIRAGWILCERIPV